MLKSSCAALTLALLFLVSCGKTDPNASAPGVGKTQSDPVAAPTPAPAGSPFEITSASGVPMIALPGGEFRMGSDQGNPDETPVHPVQVSAFLMDKFEVTHELFSKAQLPNPSHWQDHPKKPVERLRWRDAKQYCNERSLLEKLTPCYNEKTADFDCDYNANGYRLPTEAEWEYAARAGAPGPYDFGGADKLRQFAWFADNASEKTHAVGEKKPNRWGIYDLYGNVSEWCEDVYSPDYYKQSPRVDPGGPANPGKDVRRVMRGGSWKASADMCRATLRQGEKTGDSDACFFTDYCGFRCVRRASAEELRQWQGARK